MDDVDSMGGMFNPEAAEHLLALIHSVPAADRKLLASLEHDAELSAADLAQLATDGGAFADLVDESDLDSLTHGEPVLDC